MTTWNHLQTPRTLFVLVFALSFAAAGGAAETRGDERGWTLRFGGIGVDSDLDNRIDSDTGAVTRITNEVDGGLGVSAEYRFSRRLGTEVGIFAAGAGVNLSLAPLDGHVETGRVLSFVPITAGLNVHLTPDSKVDVYAGPFLAWVNYQDLSLSFRTGPFIGPGVIVHERFTIDNDFAIGANLGFDVRFGDSRWSFSGALKYLETDLEANGAGGRASASFDPLILSLGAGYRF